MKLPEKESSYICHKKIMNEGGKILWQHTMELLYQLISL